LVEGDQPTTAELCRQARRLRIGALRRVRTHFAGCYASAFHGHGMDFYDYAPYQPGDDARRIDWRVTARLPQPYVRRYREERELRVLIAMDASASMRCGPQPTPRARACTMAATIALSAAYNGDRVGGLFFADRLLGTMPPRRGRKHAMALLRRSLQPSAEAGRTDLRPVLQRLCNLRRHALVIVLSDLLTGPPPWAPEVQRLLAITAARHDLLVAVLTDGTSMTQGTGVILHGADAESGRLFHQDAYPPTGSPADHVGRMRLALSNCGVRSVFAGPRDSVHACLHALFSRHASRSVRM